MCIRDRVIVPPPDAEFGIISDIDDTVIRTDALDLLAMARNVYLHNAHTRLPFEGVAALYRALQAGTQGGYNPIYYVSSSPWNLYDLLIDFFDIRGIPLGPLFLADWGFSTDTLLTPAHRVHKLPAIQNLLETHPRLPFLLIGDSGQQDPEIYLEVARRNPGRIPVVYIRDVTSAKRDAEVHAIAEEVRRAGSEMVLVKDSAAAAEHAAARGLIVPQAEPQVKEERDEDRKAPTPLEQLLSAAG
jgi:phosphatidate phosphatase APP1